MAPNVSLDTERKILGPVKRSWEEFTDKTRTKVGV
jgi:hypothetical protein